MASEHWPTYVLLSLYVLSMIIVTIFANIHNRKQREMTGDLESSVTTHFLASKNFSVIILLFTTFASVFSGYTVVGVPNEAGVNGFSAIRWVSGVFFVAASLLMVFPRLRRISVLRSYDSPGQFIGDRYGSTPLSVLTTICLCCPQLLYISIQLHSLGLTLSFLTDGELDYYAIVIVSSLLILLFEAFGGMRSVAYTDAVQASIMVLCFLAIPIVLTAQYGGFTGQVVNTDEMPCSNSNKEETTGCLNYSSVSDISEFYLRYPSTITILNYLLFNVSLLSFSLNPHVLQRAMAAQHDWHLKFVILCMFVAGFLCMVPGLLTGITWQSNIVEFSAKYPGFPAFQAMLGILRDEGGSVAFISYMALLAAMAGIMSTADSALIGVSNTVSCDIFEKWLTPDISKTKIVWIGKAVSVCTIACSIALAAYINESGVSYAAILTLQQGILWQAFPAYVLGLYCDIQYAPILTGMTVGVVVDIILISLAFGGSDPFKAADPNLQVLDKAWSSLIGAALNVIVCGISHFCIFKKNNNENEGNDDDVLTIQEIRGFMRGIQEPLTKYYGVFVHLSTILCVIAAFHWIGGGVDPKLKEEFGDDVYALLYNGKVATVIGGFPEWSFASMMWFTIACACGMFAATTWTTNVEYEQSHQISNKSDVSLQKINMTQMSGNVVVVDQSGRTSGTDTEEGVGI